MQGNRLKTNRRFPARLWDREIPTSVVAGFYIDRTIHEITRTNTKFSAISCDFVDRFAAAPAMILGDTEQGPLLLAATERQHLLE